MELGPLIGSYAFPSGHTLNSTVCYGLIALLLAVRFRRPLQRAGIVIGWLGLCAAVALSRIYLGYPWLTDVVGGFCIGLVVLALTALMPVVAGDRRLASLINPLAPAPSAVKRPRPAASGSAPARRAPEGR